MTEYGRIHTDGSRSGGQPKQSNIFEACDVQKHTLIVEQDYASHTVKVKNLKDSQPTHRNVVVAAAPADRIGGAGVVTHGVVGVVKDTAAEWQAGYEAGVEAAAKALADDARQCDCFAFEYNECSCGAWDDYKSITSARAVEIVLT